MRYILMAGVALVGVSAFLTEARAQDAPAVFPTTTTPGKLNGAAPNSVTVSLGGRIFSGIEFESGTGNSGAAKVQSPNLVNYIRFYPSFDYVNPAGIHFGANMEIRTNGATQGGSSATNTLFGFSGVGYVSSDRFGKFAFGTPNSATDQLGVGTGDDFGTGGFYSEYGWVNAPGFAMSDAYDGNKPKQKLAYYSPSFGGFTAAVSYQPTSVGLNNSGNLLDNVPGFPGSSAQSKDRVEVAAQFARAFGAFSLKADVGYATATPTVTGTTGGDGYQTVSMFTAGAVVNFGGIEVEGSVVTGKWAFNGEDSNSPFGPSLDGATNSTSFTAGVGYANGPYSIGVVYYGVRFDEGDFGATNVNTGLLNTGKTGSVDGVAVGGSYSIGPGVSVNFDFATNTTKTPGAVFSAHDGSLREKTNGTLFAVGTYINW